VIVYCTSELRLAIYICMSSLLPLDDHLRDPTIFTRVDVREIVKLLDITRAFLDCNFSFLLCTLSARGQPVTVGRRLLGFGSQFVRNLTTQQARLESHVRVRLFLRCGHIFLSAGAQAHIAFVYLTHVTIGSLDDNPRAVG